MTITCLTITQPARLPLLRLALGDFARQAWPARELLVVHDSDEAFEREVLALARECPAARVRTLRAPAGLTLGELRERGVRAATTEFICQWDDDDRHHPQRLAAQMSELQRAGADFCFLTEQLHLFAPERELFWTDWRGEAYPLDFIQGTLLGRRACMPAYRALRRGEDTALCLDILRAGLPVTRVDGAAWLYVYVFHGGNVFAQAHHHAIRDLKALRGARLLARVPALRRELACFEPALDARGVCLPNGTLAPLLIEA